MSFHINPRNHENPHKLAQSLTEPKSLTSVPRGLLGHSRSWKVDNTNHQNMQLCDFLTWLIKELFSSTHVLTNDRVLFFKDWVVINIGYCKCLNQHRNAYFSWMYVLNFMEKTVLSKGYYMIECPRGQRDGSCSKELAMQT